MSADLRSQLAAYGVLFASQLDTLTVEDVMERRIGEGDVKALEPVEREETRSNVKRGIWLAAAVFALVVAVGVAVAVALRGTGDVADIPAPPFDSGEDAIAAIHAAQAAGDYPAYLAIFAVEVAEDGLGPRSDTTEERRSERLEFQSALLRLAAASPDPIANTEVSCDAQGTHVSVCTVFDAPPVRWRVARALTDDADRLRDAFTSTIRIRLDDDGRIFSLTESDVAYAADEELNAAVDAWVTWLNEHHPTIREQTDILLFDPGTNAMTITPDELARATWAALDEYLASA